jgi:hypothetical protein
LGDAYRDHIADSFRQRGLSVTTEVDDPGAVTFDTPYGPRRYDMVVIDANGEPNHIEVKSGNIGTKPDQVEKDQWLEANYGITVTTVFDQLPNMTH